MDELSEKLNSILSNPESVEQLRKAAEELFGKADGIAEKPVQGNQVGSELKGIGDIGAITAALSKLKNSGDDSRTALISALRPYLNPRRQEKADRAVKILRLLDMLPILQESGLLEKLF